SLWRFACCQLHTLGGKDASRARPFSCGRIEFDAAAVQLDKGTYNGKAKANAAMARPCCIGLEAVENMFEDFGRNSASLVGNGEQYLAVPPRRREIDGMTGRGKADRVREKVEEDLPDTFAVSDKGPEPLHRRDAKGQRGFPEPVLNAFRRCPHGLRDVDVLE